MKKPSPKKPPRIQRSRGDYSDPYKQTQRPGRVRPGGERDRPARGAESRPVRSSESRPPRSADTRSARTSAARPPRSFEDRPPRSAGPRAPRSEASRSAAPRSYGERSYGARPPPRADGPPRFDSPARAPRPYSPRPERVPGSFTAGAATGRFTVTLDPDVARVFRGDASVNKALRLVLQLLQVVQGPAVRPGPAWRSERGSDDGERGEKRFDARTGKRTGGRDDATDTGTESRRESHERGPRDVPAEAAGDDANSVDAPRFTDDDDYSDQEE